MKLKTNDNVTVISGKDKGKTGKVIQVFKAEDKIVVEGVNKIKKHIRSRKQGEKGQVIELSGPMATSKVMLVCPRCGKPTRVGAKIDGDKKFRVCAKCHEVI
jgi:large subunit ribosomal protein L24